jgi:uncharacterized protein YjbI with pentapeptide repeats
VIVPKEEGSMADKTQLAVLAEGVGSWNSWRAAHQKLRPDLSRASLIGVDLVNIDLSNADLSNADLRGSTLTGASLAGANLQGADCFRTMLGGADLQGANLHGARHLSCAQLEEARNWQSAFRDLELACGAPIPARHGQH